ncbi:hypothetical protein [Phenylobacterium sp. SCN 70-31]|uniref:hypothetical protein n=1 Tax=Phenylobacterium sp. SCN 70-31 TaxID=1660129 RepID=UPI0025D93DF8|nr:hypothetical protein [Phenylobacterium sp. SCN 70-31]
MRLARSFGPILVARPLRSRAARLPRGIGLLCAGGLSLGLWAGLIRFAWLVVA